VFKKKWSVKKVYIFILQLAIATGLTVAEETLEKLLMNFVRVEILENGRMAIATGLTVAEETLERLLIPSANNQIFRMRNHMNMKVMQRLHFKQQKKKNRNCLLAIELSKTPSIISKKSEYLL
jgi:hypothetical protein